MEKKELEITAGLANMEFSDGEMQKLAAAVSQMVEYFSIMESYEPGKGSTGHHISDNKNHLRKDAAGDSPLSDDILEQAPDLEDRYIAIPNVL
jgi:aspartyl-tRNA(Asn)/glutamyl-tRNA(Gln) amidotransferase subunit C